MKKNLKFHFRSLINWRTLTAPFVLASLFCISTGEYVGAQQTMTFTTNGGPEVTVGPTTLETIANGFNGVAVPDAIVATVWLNDDSEATAPMYPLDPVAGFDFRGTGNDILTINNITGGGVILKFRDPANTLGGVKGGRVLAATNMVDVNLIGGTGGLTITGANLGDANDVTYYAYGGSRITDFSRDIRISNVSFYENNVSGNGGAGGGGLFLAAQATNALQANNTTALLTDVKFDQNNVINYDAFSAAGGGLYINNIAAIGVGIALDAGGNPILVGGVNSINENTITNQGGHDGALGGGFLVEYDSNFSNDHLSDGRLAIAGYGNLHVTNNSITNDTGASIGGGMAIYLHSDDINGVFNYFESVKISDNAITSSVADERTYGGGLATHIDGGGWIDIALQDSNIDNNVLRNTTTGDAHGGGIYFDGSNNGRLSLLGTDASNKTMLVSENEIHTQEGDAYGVGIYFANGNVTTNSVLRIENAAVDSNIADVNIGNVYGGGVYSTAGVSLLLNSSIDKTDINITTGNVFGGGAHNENVLVLGYDSSVDGTNITITQKGDVHGGGVYNRDDLYLNSSSVDGTVINIERIGNVYGGGVKNDGWFADLNMEDSSISNGIINVANGNVQGGGLYNSGGEVDIDGSWRIATSFISHNIVTIGSGYGYGGGIYNTNNGEIVMDDTTIQGNKLLITHGNASGGGIYNVANLEIWDSKIIGNFAETQNGDAYGGGLYNTTDGLNIIASMINDNTVKSGNGQDAFGGGIYNTGYRLTVKDTSFKNNKAIDDNGNSQGGAIWTDAYLEIEALNGDVVFEGNEADKGKAIYAANGASVDFFAEGGTIHDKDGTYITGDLYKGGNGLLMLEGDRTIVEGDVYLNAGTTSFLAGIRAGDVADPINGPKNPTNVSGGNFVLDRYATAVFDASLRDETGTRPGNEFMGSAHFVEDGSRILIINDTADRHDAAVWFSNEMYDYGYGNNFGKEGADLINALNNAIDNRYSQLGEWVADYGIYHNERDYLTGVVDYNGLDDNFQNGGVGIYRTSKKTALMSDIRVSAALMHKNNAVFGAANDRMTQNYLYWDRVCFCEDRCASRLKKKCCPGLTHSLWANFVTRYNNLDSTFGEYGGSDFDIKSNGIQIGYDFLVTHRSQMGIMIGVEEEKSELVNDRISADDYYFGFYGSRRFSNDFDFRGAFGYGHQTYDMTRFTSILLGQSRHNSSFRGDTLEANFELGRRCYYSPCFSLRPVVGLDMYWNWTNKFSEDMTDTDSVAYGKKHFNQAFVRIGTDVQWYSGCFNLNGGVYYSYDMIGDDLAVSVYDAKDHSTLVGSKLGRSVLTLNFGGQYHLNKMKTLTAFAGYSGDIYLDRDSTPMAHNGSVGAQWRF